MLNRCSTNLNDEQKLKFVETCEDLFKAAKNSFDAALRGVVVKMSEIDGSLIVGGSPGIPRIECAT